MITKDYLLAFASAFAAGMAVGIFDHSGGEPSMFEISVIFLLSLILTGVMRISENTKK